MSGNNNIEKSGTRPDLHPDSIAEGERIFLRPMTENDCGLIVEWRNREELRRWYVYKEPFTQEGQLKYYREQVLTGKVFHYMVCLKQEPETAIGCAVFTHYEPENNTIEYGNFIGADGMRGMGLGEDITRTSLSYAFRHFGVTRVTGRIISENIVSRTSASRGGLCHEQTIRGVECSDGTVVSMELYAARPDTVARTRKQPDVPLFRI